MLAEGRTTSSPSGGRGPFQPPDALQDAAPVACQARRALSPACTLDGVALKRAMDGGCGGGLLRTLTVVDALVVSPCALRQVSP